MRRSIPKAIERLVIYNPIGLTDGRYDRPMRRSTRPTRDTSSRLPEHARRPEPLRRAQPLGWNDEFETYTRIRYSWTLSADWPRLAMVQALIGQMLYPDPVVYDWAHIKVPTLAFGGADDMLLGTAAAFQERDDLSGEDHPERQRPLQLIPGLGHVPHLEAPDKIVPPLVAFLKEGVARAGKLTPSGLFWTSTRASVSPVTRSSTNIELSLRTVTNA